jgi:hypothetical protein
MSRLGFEPKTLALKGPEATSKINGLGAETFQIHALFYNDLHIECPI